MSVADQLVFQYKSTNYILLKLPFGWDKSPKVFQNVMSSIVHASQLKNTVLILAYLDDFLLQVGMIVTWLNV